MRLIITKNSNLVTFPIQNGSLYRLRTLSYPCRAFFHPCRAFFHPCRAFCISLSTFFSTLVDLFSVDFSSSQSDALKKPTFIHRPALNCFKIIYIYIYYLTLRRYQKSTLFLIRPKAAVVAGAPKTPKPHFGGVARTIRTRLRTFFGVFALGGGKIK